MRRKRLTEIRQEYWEGRWGMGERERETRDRDGEIGVREATT